MNIGELIAYIKVEHQDAVKGLGEVRSGLLFLDRSILDVQGPLDQFLSVSNLPLLLQGVDAVWQMSGAMGVVPAAAGAAGLAMGAAKIAFMGFGDAMKNIGDPKKFAEQLKFMAPAMQDSMRAIQSFVPMWDTLKKRVQDAFWTNLDTHIKALGSTYFPVLNTALFKTATGLNRGATAGAQFLEQQNSVDDISHSFDNMSGFVEKLASNFPNLIQLILDFVTVGSDQLPAMGNGLSGLIQKFTDFIHKARESGQLADWMQRGIEAVKIFGQIVGNVFMILVNVFRASGQEGGGLLNVLLNLTNQMLAWVKSAEGQEKIGQFFQMLSAVSFPLLTIVPMLVNAFMILAQIFTSLPGPLQTVIGFMVGWGGVIAIVVSKIGPLIGILRLLKAETIITAASTVASWVTMAATTIAQGAIMLASMVVTAAGYVAQWALMAAGAMARAVVMAAAWVVAMGPVGWVIAAIVGLVALILLNWDTIKNATIAAWNAVWGFIKQVWEWIKQGVKAAVDFIVGIFMNWSVPGLIMKHWDTIKRVFSDGVAAVWNYMKELPGKIIDAISQLPEMLWDLGRRAIQRLIDGIMSMLGPVGSAIQSVAGMISGGLPHSPARFGPLSGSGSPDVVGERISMMLAEGMRKRIADVASARDAISQQASPYAMLGKILDALPINTDVVAGMKEALQGITLEIDGAGVAKLVNKGNTFNDRRRL